MKRSEDWGMLASADDHHHSSLGLTWEGREPTESAGSKRRTKILRRKGQVIRTAATFW